MILLAMPIKPCYILMFFSLSAVFFEFAHSHTRNRIVSRRSLLINGSSPPAATGGKQLFRNSSAAGQGIPIDEVLQEFYSDHGRETRAFGGSPSYARTVLYDYHQYALTAYSGLVNSEVIFILTYDLDDDRLVTSSNVYRSTDYGGTFTEITSRIVSGDTLNRLIYIGNDHKKVCFVSATSARLYLSEDEGSSFTARSLRPNTINQLSITFHPTEDDWLLAHDPINNALYVSRDLGETSFRKIADNVTAGDNFQWGDSSVYDKDASVVFYVSNGVLYSQQYPYEESDRKELHPSPAGEMNGFLLLDRYIFIVYIIDNEVTLWVSADRGPFKQAKIPSIYPHDSYIVDSIRSLQALVIIKHTNDQYNLYLSEEQGIYYYQSLENLVVEPRTIQLTFGNTIVDLEVVESTNYTTYIANQNYQSSLKRTLISFDAGANWHKLAPADNNSTDACIEPLCSLHLYMSTSQYWRTGVYSQESAPGIIIAHGTTGQYLDSSEVALYISIDGGSTWTTTLEGTWGVSVLDHGSLIVAVRDHNNNEDESRTLMYSCDEGLSWSPLTFTPFGVAIFGMVTEPGETTTVVSLYGSENISLFGWIVYVVDFMNIFTSFCGPNDYYSWVPTDKYSDTGCLLGASVTIERRRPDVCCLNRHTYNRVVNYSTCPCTLEDFECDYGYKLANGYSGHCVLDDEITTDTSCVNGEDYFLQSQGYRKIGGDVCSGGIESSFQPFNITCCVAANSDFTNSSSSSNKDLTYLGLFVAVTILLLILMIVIISIIVYHIWKSRKSRRFFFAGELSSVHDAHIYENTCSKGLIKGEESLNENLLTTINADSMNCSRRNIPHRSYPLEEETMEKKWQHPMEREIIDKMGNDYI